MSTDPRLAYPFVLAAIPVALALLNGCPGTLEGDPARFKSDAIAGTDTGTPVSCDPVKDIFPQRCSLAGCHTSAAPPEGQSGGLDLQMADIAGRIKDKPSQGKATLKLLDTAMPEQSVIYTKLLATRPFGLRMPLPVDPPLPNFEQAQIDCVKAWVIKEAASGPADAGGGDATVTDTGAGDAGAGGDG